MAISVSNMLNKTSSSFDFNSQKLADNLSDMDFNKSGKLYSNNELMPDFVGSSSIRGKIRANLVRVEDVFNKKDNYTTLNIQGLKDAKSKTYIKGEYGCIFVKEPKANGGWLVFSLNLIAEQLKDAKQLK